MASIQSKAQFDNLYTDYASLLVRIAISKVGDKDEAMDVVQDLFVDLWQRKSYQQIHTDVERYLISMLYRKIFLYFRRKGLSQKHMDHFQVIVAADARLPAQATESVANQEEAYADVMHCIDSSVEHMPPRMRTIFQLKYYRAYSNQEIADRLQLSKQTVKNQLSKSLDHIRKELSEHAVDELTFLVPVISYVLLSTEQYIG